MVLSERSSLASAVSREKLPNAEPARQPSDGRLDEEREKKGAKRSF
jgi:hypothetical protein